MSGYCWLVFSTVSPTLGMVAGKPNADHPRYGWVRMAECVLLFQSEKEAIVWGCTNIGHPDKKGWETMRVPHNEECEGSQLVASLVAPF